MKKIILVIFDNTSATNMLESGTPGQNECKLIMIDTETEEEDEDLAVITLRTDSCNKLDPDMLTEFLCPQNKVYVLLAGSDDLLPGQKNLLDKAGLLKEDSFAAKYSLTPQEILIMDHMIRGLSYKEIATKQCISYFTVKNHISNIYGKLKVKKYSAAFYKYFDHKFGVNDNC